MAIERKFGNTVYKWHVPVLLEEARDLQIRETPTDRFNLDVDAWFGEACKPTIGSVVDHMKRINAADLEDPILLSIEGHVFDGLHRLARCKLLGISTIKYKQFAVNPEPFETEDFDEFKRNRPLIADTLVWMEKNLL